MSTDMILVLSSWAVLAVVMAWAALTSEYDSEEGAE
jgi:hypothetical protein